jgi:cytochrome P450
MTQEPANQTSSAPGCPYSGSSAAGAKPAVSHIEAEDSDLVAAPKIIAPPAEATIFFDPLTFADYDHPYDTYRRLRDKAPVYFSPRLGVWVLSRYEDVQAAFKNHEQMISSKGNDIDGTHDSYGKGNLVAQDPPRHTALRQAVRRVFALREILAKEDGLREVAQTLLADMKAKESADFATDFALPFAFSASTALVGLPKKDIPFLLEHLVRSMERSVGELGVPEDAAISNEEAEVYIQEIVDERLETIAQGVEINRSDVITQVVAASEKGKVDADEIVGLTHLIYSASIDAPSALLTNIMYVMDKFPQMAPFLRQNPTMIPQFVEEVLRYETPGQNVSRQTTADLVFQGVTIPADSRVMLLQGSANRDERVFENPDEFDITRDFTKSGKIISFGDGIHACMGAPLARLMAKVAVEVLVEQTEEIRIVGFPQRWAKQLVRGFSCQPIKFYPSV